MTPRPYSEKSSLPTDPCNDATSEIPMQNYPNTPSPPTYNEATTPPPMSQEQVPIEPFMGTVVIQDSNRTPDFESATPCYPTPGDIMPYDHSLPDFIRQITNQSNLANLHSLSLRVISTLISLHRMSTYLPNLGYLDLEGSFLNSLRDIGCSFKNLQILKVGRCHLESLDGTFGLSSLRELYAQKNFISDVSPCSNLPYIRHIDVSENRICNISYAGFLSVCDKLKSIVFTGNPATEMLDYRKHVRRILPQIEVLDGVLFTNEDGEAEAQKTEMAEHYCERSDSNSVEIPRFPFVSPSESINNFFDSEDLFTLNKENKQAKNFAHQDQSDGSDLDIQEVSVDIKSTLMLQDDFHTVRREHLEQAKFAENRNVNVKQKCASILKLDKDNENRSIKTNLPLGRNFNEEYVLPSKNPECFISEKYTSIPEGGEVLTEVLSVEHELKRPSTVYDYRYDTEKSGAIKKTTLSEVSDSKIKDQMINNDWERSTLTRGSPVCGNLTAALRNRKKIRKAWDDKQRQRRFLTEDVWDQRLYEADEINTKVQIDDFGDCFDGNLGFRVPPKTT